jgi:hypothetical protein
MNLNSKTKVLTTLGGISISGRVTKINLIHGIEFAERFFRRNLEGFEMEAQK